MAATLGQPRAAVVPVRNAYHFELVQVVRRLKPAALVECWDCGGELTSGDGQGFLCTVCSSRWRSRWSPCPWWERFVMRFLPKRYRWQCYRVERA
jgi:tRNA(Ile2) C34 agmatinyltransferase TiaS